MRGTNSNVEVVARQKKASNPYVELSQKQFGMRARILVEMIGHVL